MSTTVKAGWLKDKQGNKFAPKTVSSQIVNDDGTLLTDDIGNKFDNVQQSLNVITSTYETKEDSSTKLEESKTYTDTVVSGKADKTYVDSTFAKKSDVKDVDLSNYYNKTEIDNMELITVDDIDAICGGSIQMASEVIF